MSASVQNNSRPRNRRPNHVPSRGGFSNSNSHRRDTPENESPSSPSTGSKGVYEDSRTAMVMCTVLGNHSTVTTRNGSKYKGHTAGFSEKGDIAMTDAKLEVGDSAYEQPMQGIVIPKDNFVVCVTNGVNIRGLTIGSADFTDTGITSRTNGSAQGTMKELQPWQDDDADTTTPMTLEDDQTGGWEPSAMFLENKEKFNLKSSFPEDLRGYTTDLPDPKSEGYEEREKFAQRKAEEIERSEVYRYRIAKENEDGDEESKFSSVHRNDRESGVNRDSHPGSGVKTYTCPQLRGVDGDSNPMRNGNQSRQAGRPAPRQNSPNYPPQSIHNSRQQHMNNHYHQVPPQMSNRNQRPPPTHPHHPHSMQQVPPMSQAPMQQPSRPPHSLSQATPPQPTKPNITHSNVPSLNQQHPAAAQKTVHPQHITDTKAAPLHNSQIPSAHRAPIPQQHVNGEGQHQHVSEVNAPHKTAEHYGVTSNQTACAPLIPAPKISEPAVEHKSSPAATAAPAPPQNAASPSTIPGADRRNGRGQDTSPADDNRNKVKNRVEQLKDFSHNFVLDDSSKAQESASESTEDTSNKSSAASCVSSGIGTTESSSSSNVNAVASAALSSAASSSVSASEQKSGSTLKTPEKPLESDTKSETPKSTLNPLAAEFKPKSQPTQIEAQASPPPIRVSPHVIPAAPQTQYPMWIPAMPYQTRSKGVAVARDLTAQVTGQPLLAAHGQMIYMQGQGPSYQVYPARMVAPNSFPVTQTGQQGLDQSSPQPPQVFVAGQQQLMPTAIPAHLTHQHHPQPAHGQPMPNPNSGQQPQPAHIPNPAPSPVHHHHHQQQQQQQPQALGGQQMPHPITQGPPQSVTPTHFPHLQHGMPMPRTSAGQHGMAGSGHMSVNANYPTLQQYSYPNVSSAQSNFVPTPQPQISQNSNHHNPGHQHQYVVMPQPQGQHHMQHLQGQPYSSPSIQFQQHNFHGPPLPPNHSHSHNQGANFIHHSGGLPASLHQQVPGGPSSVLMPMQSQLQPYPPQP